MRPGFIGSFTPSTVTDAAVPPPPMLNNVILAEDDSALTTEDGFNLELE